MKNKKGFTLIEVIGIIAILALILIVAVPSMTKTLKRNEHKKYDNYINNLKLVADSYLVDQLQKKNITFENDITYFTLGDIIDAGYIKESITNPNNNKKITRDSRIKVTKNLDGTYSFEVQEYYNDISDYDIKNLIVHYDSVKYNDNKVKYNDNGLKNKFKNYVSETDYDFGNNATWTEDGMLFEKKSISSTKLNQSYSTDKITISFNIKSLEDLNTTHTMPLKIYNDSTLTGRVSFNKTTVSFAASGYATVLPISMEIEKDKNYTVTFVQNDLTKRQIYINGELANETTNLSLSTINYNTIQISPLTYNLKINDLLIYNRALSDDEIKNLYNLDKDRFGE